MDIPNELGTNAERWNHTSVVPLSLYELRTEIVGASKAMRPCGASDDSSGRGRRR
jgi:hypothetical protein